MHALRLFAARWIEDEGVSIKSSNWAEASGLPPGAGDIRPANRRRDIIWRELNRRLWQVRFKISRWDQPRLRRHKVDGIMLVVLPGVFDGVLTRTGVFLARSLADLRLDSCRVLDLGCGAGLGALFAARRGAQVVATDLNPDAVRNTLLNARAAQLTDRIDVRQGDLFEPVYGERFDLILFNPPFYRAAPRSVADAAWRGQNVFERFLAELAKYLTERGAARIVLSTDGDLLPILLEARHIQVRLISRRDFWNEVLSVYELRPVQLIQSANVVCSTAEYKAAA